MYAEICRGPVRPVTALDEIYKGRVGFNKDMTTMSEQTKIPEALLRRVWCRREAHRARLIDGIAEKSELRQPPYP